MLLLFIINNTLKLCRNYKQFVKFFGFFLALSVENGWKDVI